MKKLKQKQEEWVNYRLKDKILQSFGSNYFHDYFRQIPFLKMKELLELNNINLDGQSLLVASCGGGVDVYYIKKFYNPKIFVTDISENAVKTTIASFDDVQGKKQDNENLSFEDNKFDYSFIAASLHHLPRPILGLYELLRVSKSGVIIIEPNDSLLTRIATQLGIATHIEESGNYVYRFSGRDIERISRALFYDYSLKRCFAIHKVAKSKIEFLILKILNGIANIITPSQGNYIIFIICKNKNV